MKKEKIELEMKKEKTELEVKKGKTELEVKKEKIEFEMEKEKTELEVKKEFEEYFLKQLREKFLESVVGPSLLKEEEGEVVSWTIYVNEAVKLLPPGALLHSLLHFLLGSPLLPPESKHSPESTLRTLLIQRILSPSDHVHSFLPTSLSILLFHSFLIILSHSFYSFLTLLSSKKSYLCAR